VTEQDPLPPRQEIIVTLVHGTILLGRWPIVIGLLRRVRDAFSRGDAKLEWYQRGSPFATSLTKALGQDWDCDIRSFPWSGGNTVWDRLSAAVRLRQHIATIAKEHSTAVQVLVGHSHGGSVCLAALGDPETRKKVEAFVSLATPYVHVRQRSDSENVTTTLGILGLLLFTAAMLTTMFWLEPRVGEFWSVVVVTTAILAAAALGAIVWNRRRARIDVVRAWAESLKEYQEEDGAPARMIVISDGDEALLALKIAEALSAMSRGLWRAAYRVVELVERAWDSMRWRIWIIYGCLAAALLVLGFRYDDASPWGPVAGVPWTIWFLLKVVFIAIIAPVFLVFLVGVALFVPALVALLVGFPPLVFFRWLAFGWGGSPGVDVTAESLPLGTVTAVRLPEPAPPLVPTEHGLRHAELHNDARVPPLIASFLEKRVLPASCNGVVKQRLEDS
jgi:hypothetical protein